MPPSDKKMDKAITSTINEALLFDIMAIYSEAEDKMLKSVAKRVAKGIKTEGWNESKLKDTQLLVKDIEAVLNNTKMKSKTKVSQGIIEAYKYGVNNVDAAKGLHKTVLDELDIPMNLKMQVLAANNLLDNASFQVLRKANDAYKDVMAHATTGLLAGTDTRIQASQKMLNEFASKGITTFVDKAGRNWDLSSYAEMAVRTVSAHAALQGHIDRQIEVGEDLVRVSTIGTTCPICARWQGVVLSISGKSPKYHSVEEAKASGLFHPNCKHTLVMHIPELDGEGKVEPLPEGTKTKETERYDLIQQQRANERKIRYWKKSSALAITPEEQAKANQKVKYWQYTNLLHCEKHGLQRLYAREGVMKGKPSGSMGTLGLGGYLKDYHDLYVDVMGVNPKTVHGTSLKLDLQHFGGGSVIKQYSKWLKDAIKSLDQLDIDKAQMKDSNNKAVTPTSLYKKYIGDSPLQDYAVVSPFEKGTKEFKSDYAKWLKQQIEEIGVSYGVKPEYIEVHEDISEEDKALSATNIYKKYYGEAPTEAYKKLGGEAGTGMKYGKWVETQKKELIKNGITKTVPFDNATVQKTADVISQATQTIDNAKATLKQDALEKYKKKLEDKVHGAYDGYLQVKEALELMNEKYEEVDSIEDEAFKLEVEKVKLAKAKHLEMVKKKAEKSNDSAFDYDYNKLKDILAKETDMNMKEHIKAQIGVYEEVKKTKEALSANQAKKKEATDFLNEVKADPDAFSISSIKAKVKDNIDNPDIYEVYLQAIKAKKKDDFKLDFEDEFYKTKQEIEDKKHSIQWKVDHYKQSGDKVNELAFNAQLEAFVEAEKEYAEQKKKVEEDAKTALAKAKQSGKVTLGRETKFNEGQLVERDRIYQNLDLSDLETLSDQVAGHKLFENSNRRDILGRDRVTARNHHMGHDVRIKSGLTGADKELAEAFAFAYDEYFNTIKCQPINLAYLQGYENATPAMRKKIDKINRAIQSVELNEPILLHRFVDRDIVEAIFGTSDVQTLEKGDLFDNNTFMSTATGGHPTFGKRNYKLTLQVDKGTHALPTLNHEELEVLLGKGKLEFVRANKHTKSNPQRLKNYDGTWTEFVGDEIVVRYIEDSKAKSYEKVTPESMNKMLQAETNVKVHTSTESKGWLSAITADEKSSTVKYTGSYYTEINNVYRRNDTSNKTITKNAHDMTSAFRKASTTEPVVLRRGIYEQDLAFMLGFNGDYSKVVANWDKINEGGFAAEDKGFLSTSPYGRGGFTSKPVDLRIYCPTGTHAAYVAPISHYQSEKETILQSGSMYRVLKLEKESGKIVAYVELLGTD